jgi:hypothetical protein
MQKLSSIHFFLVILFKFISPQLNGQQLSLQTYSLAADQFITKQLDGLQVDWRLDLGMTAMALDQSKQYHFSAGFLQPSINRFTKDGLEGKYNPSIDLRTSDGGNAITVFSKEPDLIFFDCKIYTLQGQVVLSDPVKYRSSYTGRHINMNVLASGVYILQVHYLPEFLTFESKTNYWIKSLKFIKP